MSWYTSGQHDQNRRTFLLNSAHGAYETKRAILQTLGGLLFYTIADGAVADTKVVTSYVTDAEITSNSLDIGGAVLDRVHNFVNPNAAAISIHTNEWGDKFPVWGQFLQQPQAMPTTSVDRLVQHWKVGGEAVKYIAQENAGTGDGSSYANRRRVRDFLGEDTADLLSTDIVVLCGELSRFAGEGNQSGLNAGSSLIPKSGTSGSRTQIISHPADPWVTWGGVKLGDGSWGQASSWTDEGGGMWSIVTGATVGVAGTGFTMTNAGGTRRALTLVGSAAACAALADSVFAEPNYSGSDDRIYVHLADGSDPKNTTFFGCSNAGGINLLIAGKEYFDVLGGEFLMAPMIGTGTLGATQFAFYACKMAYSAFGELLSYSGGAVIEATGAFDIGSTPVPPVNRWVIGCEFSHAQQAIYDTCPHNLVPVNQKIRDNYCHDLSLADDHGFDLHSTSDAHVFASFGGWDGAEIENNSVSNVGSQPIVVYNSGTNFNTPTGGLELTDGYVLGLGFPGDCNDRGDGTWDWAGAPGRNLKIKWNWLQNLNVQNLGGGYAGTTDMGVSLNGDSPMHGRNGFFSGNEIAYNRIEAQINDGAIRIKWSWPDGDTDVPWVHHNVIRDALKALRVFTVTDYAGVNFDPSFLFEDNDVHARDFFAELSNVLNPDHHSMVLRNNTYRTNDLTNGFRKGGSGENNLATWQTLAPTGDDYDTGSTATAFTADTGSPTLTATVVGDNVVYTLGSDPDGATSDLEYQTFVDGELIEGAESDTFNKSAYPGGTQIQGVILGQDAKGKWFLVTSNTVTLEETPDVPISPTGGIPLSEDEYYRKLKKNELPSETVELAPPIPRVVQTGVVTVERPKASPIRSDTALKAALERAEQIARERPKKRNRRKDDDWFILN